MSDFYNDIEQFRNIVRAVKDRSTYVRTEEDGKVIRNPNAVLPTLEFIGSTKLHGTNAAVRYDYNTEEVTALSRNNELSIEKDNYGFASFVQSNVQSFSNLFRHLHNKLPLDFLNDYSNMDKLIIYGEWVGPGIQSGVAISQLEDKKFFIFDVKIILENEDVYWFSYKELQNIDHSRIKSIYDYEMFSISIDFNNLDSVVNTMIDMVNKVEQECPVSKAFNISGIGEGIVFFTELETMYPGLVSKIRYKVKGEKYSVSKVKTLTAVDPEKLNSISEFVEYAVTENRLNQMIENLKRDGIEIIDKNTGTFLKYLNNDILKEEFDVLIESGLEFKDVVKAVQTKARKFFLNYISV